MPSFSDWPESPLDAAQRAFDLLVCPPAPLAFDGRGFAGCPEEILPLDKLKRFLLSPRTPGSVRDVVWRELLTRARRDGPAWVLAAVGVAMPGLRARAGALSRGYRGDSDDVDAELLATFVDRLRRIDLDQPHLIARLLDAADRAGRKIRYADVRTEVLDSEPAGPRTPLHPWDHPEFVLARAIATGVIDADDANMIAATRLEGVPVQAAAARCGISAQLASHWRARAEQRVVEAIRAGELAYVTLRSRPRRAAQRIALHAWPAQ